jgi:Rhodopirellula transposase DDE domain
LAPTRGGKEWNPAGQPEEVNVHDFVDPELGRANPYGVYDIGADQGWVSDKTDHDTAAFAVQTIRRWWLTMGQPRYPDARELTITADGGGSHGHRVRLWKLELGRLAQDIGLNIWCATFRQARQVEQDRAPHVLLHHDELVRPPVDQS